MAAWLQAENVHYQLVKVFCQHKAHKAQHKARKAQHVHLQLTASPAMMIALPGSLSGKTLMYTKLDPLTCRVWGI